MRINSLAALVVFGFSSAAFSQGGQDGHIVGTERAPGSTEAANAMAVTPLAHVEQRGTGSIDLILIPGLSCDWRVFEAFMERNKGAYRMWAVTLPGFGGSAAPPLPANSKLTELAWLNNAESAILKLINEQKLVKPIVAGHSLGGHIAMRMAIRHGELIQRAVIIDSIPLFPPRLVPTDEDESPERRVVVAQSQNEVMRLIPPENWAKQQRGGMPFMVKSPERAKELAEMCAGVPRDTTIQYMCEMMVSDLRKSVQGVSVPMLVLSAVSADFGAEGVQQQKNTVAEQFKGSNANVQVVYFEDTRHFVMDDRPKELDAAIAAFVAGKPVSGVASSVPAAAPSK